MIYYHLIILIVQNYSQIPLFINYKHKYWYKKNHMLPSKHSHSLELEQLERLCSENNTPPTPTPTPTPLLAHDYQYYGFISDPMS